MFNQAMAGVRFDELCTLIRFFRNISGNEHNNREEDLISRVRVEVSVSAVYFQGAVFPSFKSFDTNPLSVTDPRVSEEYQNLNLSSKYRGTTFLQSTGERPTVRFSTGSPLSSLHFTSSGVLSALRCRCNCYVNDVQRARIHNRLYNEAVSGAAGTSQLQGPRFHPEIRLLCVWSLTRCLQVFRFPPTSEKIMKVGTLERCMESLGEKKGF